MIPGPWPDRKAACTRIVALLPIGSPAGDIAEPVTSSETARYYET